MMVVVSYDMNTMQKEGRKRLRRVAKACSDYGQRVQFSVFECLVDPVQFAILKKRLLEEYDPNEDSIRFYYLGGRWKNKVENYGIKNPVDLEGPLII